MCVGGGGLHYKNWRGGALMQGLEASVMLKRSLKVFKGWGCGWG